MDRFIFNGFEGVLRTIAIGVLSYAALVAFLRVSGKRTLSKMNAFDLVVTVALGSTLATILLDKNVALAEGLTALSVLISLQYLVAWLSSRTPIIERLVKSEPAMLFRHGEPLHSQLKKHRITEDEILAAIRDQGVADVRSVAAVVLETDGTFSVVESKPGLSYSSLANVDGSGGL